MLEGPRDLGRLLSGDARGRLCPVSTHAPSGVTADDGPWFRRYPRWAALVGTVLFAVVFAARVLMPEDPGSGLTSFFLLPVALFALGWGLRGGVLAGLVAGLLTLAWVVIDDVDLSALGWLSRLVPQLVVGALLGQAADHIEASQQARRAHALAMLRHRQAVELNDTLIQGMAAAKWSMEAGQTEAGLSGLTETLELGHQMVSELLREADMGLDGHRGDLGGEKLRSSGSSS